jgi:hypothetical protein
MIICGKILTKTDKNFAFWQEYGDFNEFMAKKSPTLPGLVKSVSISRKTLGDNSVSHCNK